MKAILTIVSLVTVAACAGEATDQPLSHVEQVSSPIIDTILWKDETITFYDVQLEGESSVIVQMTGPMKEGEAFALLQERAPEFPSPAELWINVTERMDVPLQLEFDHQKHVERYGRSPKYQQVSLDTSPVARVEKANVIPPPVDYSVILGHVGNGTCLENVRLGNAWNTHGNSVVGCSEVFPEHPTDFFNVGFSVLDSATCHASYDSKGLIRFGLYNSSELPSTFQIPQDVTLCYGSGTASWTCNTAVSVPAGNYSSYTWDTATLKRMGLGVVNPANALYSDKWAAGRLRIGGAPPPFGSEYCVVPPETLNPIRVSPSAR